MGALMLRVSVMTTRYVWVPAGPAFPDAQEWAYTSAELSRALYVYSTMVARLLSPVDAPQGFRLTAHDSRGIAVGHHQWHVSAETGRFVPSAPPLALLDVTNALTA